MTKGRKVFLICSVIGVCSMFIPSWYEVCLFGRCSTGDNGFQFMRKFGMGYLAFVSFLGIGAVAIIGNKKLGFEKGLWIGALSCGLLATASVLWSWNHHVAILGSQGLGFPLYSAAAAAIGAPLSILVTWFAKE